MVTFADINGLPLGDKPFSQRALPGLVLDTVVPPITPPMPGDVGDDPGESPPPEQSRSVSEEVGKVAKS